MALKPVKTTVKHMYHQPYYKRFFSRISEQVGASTSTNRFRDRLYAKKVYCCYEVVWARNGYYFCSRIILAYFGSALLFWLTYQNY